MSTLEAKMEVKALTTEQVEQARMRGKFAEALRTTDIKQAVGPQHSVYRFKAGCAIQVFLHDVLGLHGSLEKNEYDMFSSLTGIDSGHMFYLNDCVKLSFKTLAVIVETNRVSEVYNKLKIVEE